MIFLLRGTLRWPGSRNSTAESKQIDRSKTDFLPWKVTHHRSSHTVDAIIFPRSLILAAQRKIYYESCHVATDAELFTPRFCFEIMAITEPYFLCNPHSSPDESKYTYRRSSYNMDEDGQYFCMFVESYVEDEQFLVSL